MKKITVLTGLILATWAGAKVCEQAYHLQEAFQYILTGNSPATLKTVGAGYKLDKGMNAATLLHDSTEYKMITDWNGSCEWAKSEVDFAYRKKGTHNFTVQNSMDYSVKIDDRTFSFKKPGWDDYWFGIASKVSGDTIALYDAVGKFKNKPQLNLWYGNATMKRTLYSSTGASKGSFTHFYPELTSHPDSAALDSILLATWSSFTNSDTQKVEFTVQLIKLTYDSVPTPSTGVRAHNKAKTGLNGFQASQTGNLVLIQPGDKKAATGEPLSLYGMMGNKIAALHPTGYVYQWNGKTSEGADAPTGVYFVQSGSRILGKFFYSR
jgi:hypothetical protein